GHVRYHVAGALSSRSESHWLRGRADGALDPRADFDVVLNRLTFDGPEIARLGQVPFAATRSLGPRPRRRPDSRMPLQPAPNHDHLPAAGGAPRESHNGLPLLTRRKALAGF